MKKYATLAALALSSALALHAQQTDGGSAFTLHGSVQSDILTFPQEDERIGTGTYKDDFMTNTYAELHLLNKYIQAGARFEFLEHPMPGFEQDFKGWGVPNFYVKGSYKGAELTLGDFYDQFGSGLIFRTYEERSLGIDNSLLGGRLVVDALKGVRLKALGGKQRRYWDLNDSWVYGADAELSFHDWFPRMQEHNTALTLGASWVTKQEKSEEIGRTITKYDADGMPHLFTQSLKLPEKVGSFDVRANLRKGNYSFLAEYAQKSQDPSYDNGYSYRNGRALMLSGSYSKRGMSFLAQVKRSEDMAFRSRRSMTLTSSFINHLPAFTQQQTYSLATIYPYATQNVPGEWAFQAEGSYTFKRKTPLGGKYGTTIKAAFSHVRAGETPVAKEIAPNGNYYTYLKSDKTALYGTQGFENGNFWKVGDEKYYQEFSVDLDKKITKTFKLNLKYLHQQYNKTVVEGEGGMIKANIAIAEGKWNINRKFALRAEAQYLHTKQDQKDWWFGLIEFSMLPHFMFTISDQYNAHVVDAEGNENKVHYFQGLVTFTQKSHRLSVGYGKTRAGYNCSGGVCRYVPAQKGVTASYTYNF